jgi:hypothetical protein
MVSNHHHLLVSCSTLYFVHIFQHVPTIYFYSLKIYLQHYEAVCAPLISSLLFRSPTVLRKHFDTHLTFPTYCTSLCVSETDDWLM